MKKLKKMMMPHRPLPQRASEVEWVKIKYTDFAARKYQNRKPSKHQAELKLIDEAFEIVPPRHRVLDIPCGGGRVSVHLRKHHYHVCGADASPAMLRHARGLAESERQEIDFQQEDIMSLSYSNQSFDTVLCFRLFHHFKDLHSKACLVREVCRVAANYVLISYFSPYSMTSMKRKLRQWLGLKNDGKQSSSLGYLTALFAEHGFKLDRNFAQWRGIKTLHLARFKRTVVTP